MTELHNPLFEDEKEFLERKKLEYERALRGDVEHIKDQSVMVGKVALVGAGLAGGIWLITKAFSGKKRKRRFAAEDDDELDDDYGQYYTSGQGKRYRSKVYHPTAQDSAAVFMASSEGDVDDFGFGASAPTPEEYTGDLFADTTPHGSASAYSTAGEEEEDPFQDLPYDDSRRLPTSHAFDEDGYDQAHGQMNGQAHPSTTSTVLKSFLQSDTGKVIVAQVAAVALAFVTKKLNEFFPAAKNSDLATSPGYGPSETGFSPVATSDSLASPDASFYPQPS
ncbi:hypothetical protein GCM10023185_10350 [Hymenobacter saemangeumensis]|uniref:YtxH domain-containing protein n=1 Tax=Hymenobacter saemangeumensis TaxID=1084522 RepID=A0ABP8I531_9BACT